MKINQTQLFDSQNLLKGADSTVATIVKGLRPFFAYVNGVVENLVKAVSGQLTLGDNLKGQLLSVKLTHATSVKVALTSRDIHGLVSLRCDGNTVEGLDYAFAADDSFSITAYFRDTTTGEAHTCVIFAFRK